MSIYSGFATRVQQNAYDQLVIDLIQVLQRRIIKFYVEEEADQAKFHNILLNLYSHFTKMEESKYLEPKISSTFKQLIQLTTSITKVQEEEPKVTKENHKKIAIQSKQSLNFSADRLQLDCKNISKIRNLPGRIKHQVSNNNEGLSSRGQSNPEISGEKKVQKQYKLQIGRQPNLLEKKNFQKWSAVFDNNPPAVVETEQEKKNVQYVIREYVSRGQTRRRHKKQNYFD